MIQKKLRIIFMGTPDFAVPALDAIVQSGYEVICVYAQPPRPKGRGQQITPSPVQAYAAGKNIPVRHPESLKSEAAQTEFAALQADIAVVAAYGLILPKAILEAPPYGCLNIHASLLPRWRGASPVQHAILAGDDKTGVTIMQMDEGLDTGGMIARETMLINDKTTTPGLQDDLSALGAKLIVRMLDRLVSEGDLKAQPQDSAQSTYAPLLKKEDGRVDWNKSAEDIARQVRALNPWPGVWCEVNGKRLKIKQTAVSATMSDQPRGSILNREGEVACGGHTVLKLEQIQPENSKAMDFAAAMNGGHISEKNILA